MLRIRKAGLQTTLQGQARIGQRFVGMPYAGPADPLSMALANRLVGNPADATCLEITYGGFEAEIEIACSMALAGAPSDLAVSGQAHSFHKTLHLQPGDTLTLAPPVQGVRAYLAIHSAFEAAVQFGSTSTYLTAEIGGLEGRALRADDTIRARGSTTFGDTLETPEALRPVFTHQFALRATRSSETDLLTADSERALFSEMFTIGRQATRMGLALTGHTLTVESDGMMKSAPVFPGTIQCPPSGLPIVLSCDAQTTGGYPRIASIARCDRHLLGQMRPGDQVRLLHRAPEAALEDDQRKQNFFSDWLEDGF